MRMFPVILVVLVLLTVSVALYLNMNQRWENQANLIHQTIQKSVVAFYYDAQKVRWRRVHVSSLKSSKRSVMVFIEDQTGKELLVKHWPLEQEFFGWDETTAGHLARVA